MMSKRRRRRLPVVAALSLILLASISHAFVLTSKSRVKTMHMLMMSTNNDNKNVKFVDDKTDSDSSSDAPNQTTSRRWKSLTPKEKLQQWRESQERAIRNKKKREPKQEQKRRMMMFVKKKQVQKKRASRVKRPLGLYSDERTPLDQLQPGSQQYSGTVISLTPFGAYVDIGTQGCDGLLHISQMSREVFVEHPKQIVSPGDVVQVYVKSVNPELKKLHLTMLSKEEEEGLWNDRQQQDSEDEEERIGLEELAVDDELWGEIKRVTDFGGYVELGAVVDGFLHFMDHPEFGATPGAPPSEFMSVGDRVRVWVSDVDMERRRVKLTANRPQHLPGPRREIF